MDTKKSTMATPTLETFANQTQVFASAWSLINRQFGGEDSLERAEVERGILLDMARRLIEDHDAARQEIASLKAQHYDQQAMGLCHACGWKGVIDYPDGPVCVACEHDKTLSPQPTAQAALAGMEPVATVTCEGVMGVSFTSSSTYGCDLAVGTKLYTESQVQAMLAGAPTPPLTNIGDKP